MRFKADLKLHLPGFLKNQKNMKKGLFGYAGLRISPAVLARGAGLPRWPASQSCKKVLQAH
ncbi:hypothetical protein BDI4_1450007 [Burkholderia diffusa]|nr:hypothetical protein BDI4_1450007 [Burkholderia diffusa]